MGIDAQMIVKTCQPYTEKEVRWLSVDLAEAFGHSRFFIDEEYGSWRGETKGQHALEIVTEFTQDGDSIFPAEGETLIEVHLWTRYYGVGYERGDLPLIIAVAQWLEARIPDAQILYGGDSSGVCGEPFDAESRTVYWGHFCRVGHRPYLGGLGSVFGKNAVVCGFCDRAMTSYGGGGTRTFYGCDGCGKKAIYDRATHETQVVPKGKDFFDMRATA